MSFSNHPIKRFLRTFKKAAVAAGLLYGVVAASSSAMAAPIGDASFGIGGAFTLPSGATLGTTNSIFISNGGMIIVSVADTNDLHTLVTFGELGTLKDLPSISGFVPINAYISLASGVSIDLASLQIVQQIGPTGPNYAGFINLMGNVFLNAPGFDKTAGVLTFTGTSSDNESFTLAVTTSASTPPAGVPEPMSLALLGLGLVGLFGFARRRTTPLQSI